MAFDFPNPPTADPVTNPATGVTYQYDAASQTWVVISNSAAETLGGTIDDLQADVSTLQSLLPAETSARQAGDAALQNQIDTLDIPDPFNPAPLYGAIETEGRTRQLADENLQQQIDGIESGGDVNLDNYYTKDEIDNQFTLRGVGYNYLMSSFSGTPTIRPGEIHTNNRIVGQVTFISMGPEDDNGKARRDAVVGDTIEIYEATYDHYFRYEITSYGGDGIWGVQYVGNEEDRDYPLGIGYPYLVYLYPTHISSANYYTKSEMQTLYLKKTEGTAQTLKSNVKYTGLISETQHLVHKGYVDSQINGVYDAISNGNYASLQYVNDEVDKMVTSFNTEDAEPDIFYGDYAPTGEMKNGNIWFDSMSLRLNIWSQGAWINPDRNDGKDLENRITALETRIAQLEGN